MLGVITHHSSLQCLFPKQSTLSSAVLARPAVGVCQVTEGRNAGVSWWSEWREATLTPVQLSESQWPLQTAASGDQLKVALVWSQHQCPESRGACLVLTDNRQLMRSGLAVSAWKWGLRIEDTSWKTFANCLLLRPLRLKTIRETRTVWLLVSWGSDLVSVKKACLQLDPSIDKASSSLTLTLNIGKKKWFKRSRIKHGGKQWWS